MRSRRRMDNKRISDFIRGYAAEEDELLQRIRSECESAGVPLIRPETAMFLRTVTALVRPHLVLEIGTAAGYSAICMAGSFEGIERIDTLEDWEPRYAIAEANIKEARLTDRISLIKGDASETMKSLTGPYDMVFIDAAKGQYPDYLKEAMRLTAVGSVIIADNILMDGEIIESRYLVERRDRTIHKRIREFLDDITGDDRLVTSLIPVGDGITFSVRER